MSEYFPTIITHGNHEIYIENFEKIQEFNDTKVELKSQKFKITIIGNALLIDYMTNDDLKICGIIKEIQICEVKL